MILKGFNIKFIRLILIIFFSVIMMSLPKYVEASTVLNGIDNFPKSYKPYLEILQKKYPNWSFSALYVNLDWNYVVSQENIFGKNLVPKNYSDSWKNTTPGQYDVEVDGGWVDSSKQAVEYCMDPRNFLNEVRIFQFEGLSYDKNTNSLNGIEKILYGTEFYQTKVNYLDSNGTNVSMDETYGELILKAGQTSYVSAYHLASRIKQEVGPFLSHGSISGTVEGYEGLYNFYNIGATSSTTQMGAIKKGLQYAKDANGASQSIKDKYLIPWNTKERAITGGAIFIGSSYINRGQNTIYLQKFHVNDNYGGELFWHQYMTNVLAPYSESKSIYNGYQKTGILDMPLEFIIPVYNNMPEIPIDSPNINENNFIDDNTKVYCNAVNVNVRTGPSTSYEIITTVSNNAKMTRIKKGNQTGERWDKVILENGIIGYIYQPYVTEVNEIEIERIDISIDNTIILKGEKEQLNVKIYPEDATNQNIIYVSSNPQVASIDDKGIIQAHTSGKTIITVKTENNLVSNQIEIEVYSKVTGINVSQKEIYMQKGNTFKINAYITPDDANNQKINYKVVDEEIASIDDNGIVTAEKEGETTIIISSDENSAIKQECILKVIRQIEDWEIHFDSSLSVNSSQISGIDYNNNTVLDLKNKIITDLDIQIVNKDNEILNNTNIVGTGNKIQIIEQGEVLIEYTIILYGDVNGDGKINSIDLLVLQRHILEIQKLDEIYKKAANISKNGKQPTSVDLLLIQRHILQLQIIDQS